MTSTQLISVQKHLTIFWALREAHPAILEARGVSLARDQPFQFHWTKLLISMKMKTTRWSLTHLASLFQYPVHGLSVSQRLGVSTMGNISSLNILDNIDDLPSNPASRTACRCESCDQRVAHQANLQTVALMSLPFKCTTPNSIKSYQQEESVVLMNKDM